MSYKNAATAEELEAVIGGDVPVAEAEHAASADSAAQAAKVGDANVGSSTRPVYLDAGTPKQCGNTLNVSISGNAATATSAQSAANAANAENAAHAASADTATNAQKAAEADHATSADTAQTAQTATRAESAANATNAENAENADHAATADSATTAASATRATQDGAGNNIEQVYAKKTELGAVFSVSATGCLTNAAISSFTVGDLLVVNVEGVVDADSSTQPILTWMGSDRQHIATVATYNGLWVSNAIGTNIPITVTVQNGGKTVTAQNLWNYRGYRIGGTLAIPLLSVANALALTEEQINAFGAEEKATALNFIAKYRR